MGSTKSNLQQRINYLNANKSPLTSQWQARASEEIASQRQQGFNEQFMRRLICVAHYSAAVLGEELWNFEEAYVCLLSQTFLHGPRQVTEIVKGFGDDASMRLFILRYPGFERSTIACVIEPPSLAPTFVNNTLLGDR